MEKRIFGSRHIGKNDCGKLQGVLNDFVHKQTEFRRFSSYPQLLLVGLSTRIRTPLRTGQYLPLSLENFSVLTTLYLHYEDAQHREQSLN